MEIKTPKQATLDKYGLSLEGWKEIWKRQGKKCPICGKEPKTGTGCEFNVDHEHIKSWKKMPPEERRLYVRGIVCYMCNRYYMAKGMTNKKAMGIVNYLNDYDARWENIGANEEPVK